MKIKQIVSSAIIVVVMAQLSLGQSALHSLRAASSDFSISISPSEVVIPPGGTANYTITVTEASVSSTGLIFSIAGLPPDSTATITMESATVYALSITTSRSTRQREYTFTVTATNGGMSASASANLIVLLAGS